jgi:hypothetical protein
MLIDALTMLRADGSNATIQGSNETGATSLARDGTTGKVVIPIHQTPKKGIPVVCVFAASSVSGREWVVTIEACASATDWTHKEIVATFPKIAANGSDIMIRRIHTDKKYIRHVVTTTAGSTGDLALVVFAGIGLMNKG